MIDTNDGSPVSAQVTVERNVAIPMRDGVELAADIYHPTAATDDVTQPLPTIVERTPYGRTREFMERCGQFFAARGYCWMAVDCRGRFDSDGDFQFFFNPHHEGLDGHDTIEWVAAQPWSNGKVGTTGLSFAGANQQATAITRPPHLTTQIIIDCGFSYWRRPLRNNGAFHLCGMTPYVIKMAIGGREATDDPAVRIALEKFLADTEAWIDGIPPVPGRTPLALAPSYESWYLAMSTQGDDGGIFHNPMVSLDRYIDQYPDIPVCFLAGWYGMRHAWANLRKHEILTSRNSSPVKTVIGPWLHEDEFMEQSSAGGVDLGATACRGLNDFRLRWFDQFLKGIETGVLGERPLEVFTMGGGSGRKRSIDGRLDHGGHWVEVNTWPPKGATEVAFFLNGDGRLSAEQPEPDAAPLDYTFDPQKPVPTIGGGVTLSSTTAGLDLDYINIGGGYDQRGGQPGFPLAPDESALGDRPDVLVFRTDPLDEPIEICGDLRVELWVRSSAVDTDFTAKIVDEYPPTPDYPEGFALNLVDDILRMSYRDGRTERELIDPGKLYRITLGPLPISNRFERNHRIRLDISSSNFPQFDVNPNTGGPLGRHDECVVAKNSVFVDARHASNMSLVLVTGELREERRQQR